MRNLLAPLSPKKLNALLVASLSVFALSTNAEYQVSTSKLNPAKDTVTQVSSYNGLLTALYDGVVSYEELQPFGNFGLGTFDRMDGEMIMIDGILYQVDFDGEVHVMPMSAVTPYATITNFEVDQRIPLPEGSSYDQVSTLVEGKLPNLNIPYAVRIDGTFSYIKCRSIPAQNKPYQPLTEITKKQSIFEKKNVKGSLIGFRYPKYAGAFNPPGFHLHFLSDDRTFGGHVLSFTTGSGVVAKLDQCHKMLVYIPDDEASRKADLSRDFSAETNQVNRSK